MAWQGNGMCAAWARHAMCESAFILTADSTQVLQHLAVPHLSQGTFEETPLHVTLHYDQYLARQLVLNIYSRVGTADVSILTAYRPGCRS